MSIRKSPSSKKKPKPKEVRRNSPLAALVGNPGTGSGVYGDNSIQRVFKTKKGKRNYAKWKAEFDLLYENDGILQQVISDPINDSLSEWRETGAQLAQIEQELDYKRIFMKSGIYARKNGQSLIIPILMNPDGGKVPLTTSVQNAVNSGATISRLMVVDCFEESTTTITDTFSQYHGMPTYYTIGKKNVRVNTSRVIPVFANLEKTSIFQAVEEYMSAYQLARQDVSRAVQEANFLVLKTNFDELSKIVDDGNIVNGTDNDLEHLLENRVRNLRCNANNNNAYAIDKEFEEIDNIQKANINDMVGALDQMAQFYAASTNIPMSKLFARTLTGLNSNNRVDLENYVQFLKGMRFMVLEPSLIDLDKFVQMFNPGLDISFTWNPISIERYIPFTYQQAQDNGDNE